jgi:O-antigen/teichoic acid export membrane protein
LTPQIIRQHGSDNFGYFSASYAFITVAGSLLSLKGETALIAQTKDFIFHQLILMCIISSITFTLILLLILFIFKLQPDNASFFNISTLLLIIGATFAQSIVVIFTAIATKTGAHQKIAVCKFISYAGIASFAALFVFFHEVSSLIYGVLFSLTCQIVILFDKKTMRELLFLKIEATSIKEFKHACKYNLPASALDTISQQIPLFLILPYFGGAVAGMYALASRVIAAPFSSISGSYNVVFSTSFANAENKNDRIFLIFKYWRQLLVLSLILYLPAIVISPFAFAFIYGHDWRLAGQIASMLSIMYAFNIIFSPTSTAFVVIKQQRILLYASILAFIYRAFAFTLGIYCDSILIAIAALVLFEVTQIIITNKLLIFHLNKDKK